VIDYIINKECDVKAELGIQGLIDLVKSRNQAVLVFRSLLEQGKTEKEAMDTTFVSQTVVVEGEDQMREIKVRDLFTQTNHLKQLAPICADCPLNAGREAFGCYRTVRYPISSEAERWLSGLVHQATEQGLPRSILIKFILDEEIPGEFFQRLRQDPHRRFLESQEPYEITVEKKLLKKTKVTTDQILDMMFALGTMERTHQMFLIFLSGAVVISDIEPDPRLYTSDFQAAAISGQDGKVDYWLFHLPLAPSDDESIGDIKEYFRNVFSAFATAQTISIDY